MMLEVYPSTVPVKVTLVIAVQKFCFPENRCNVSTMADR